MKKQIVSILCLLFTFLVVSAQDVMQIQKKDGTKENIPVVQIENITFVDGGDISVIISKQELASTTSFTIQYTVNTTHTVDEVGITYGLNNTASTYTKKGTLTDGVGSVTVTNLDFEKSYYVKAYAKIDGETYESDITSVTTPSQYPVANTVNLGLSVLWADCNMGGVNELNTGSFLPWGDITGAAYNASTYPKQTISIDCISGYPDYDIVTAKWGSDWRLPTLEEFQELWDNTTHTVINNYNDEGYTAIKFTAKNGKSITLPLGGSYENGKQYNKNLVGFYWCGDYLSKNNGWASCFGLQSATNGYETSAEKYLRMLIRPVYGPMSGGSSTQDHEYVDLGLPIDWATMNYGAVSETDLGTYVAWAETAAKDTYTRDNYKYYTDGTYTNISTQLNSKKLDVVANNWGGKWHMPSYSQMNALITQCTWTYTTVNGVSGYRVTGKNGNSIFLPVTGSKSTAKYFPSEGYYWSGEQYYGETAWGYCLNFDSTTKYIKGQPKYWGCVIRPCREK